ncbi:hypothetical protein BDZ97DRAFT_1924155 [Flammula alnicola]|nr:hypothetical protein BDZ97DRAFT_1924155 [Flammula alnicola]
MVNTRVFVAQTPSSIEANLRARLYPASSRRPRQILVNTRQPSAQRSMKRYPFAENHLGESVLQPWVHNCVVTVQEGRHTYRYMIFFKRHRLFGPSQCLQTLSNGQPSFLRSDVVVMRIGTTASYVNMRGRDSVLADWLMCRYALFAL